MGRWFGLVFIGLGIWQFFAGGQGLRKYRAATQKQTIAKRIVSWLFTFGLGTILILWGLLVLFVKN
ncbi:hypothetical protein WOSG25_081280 [Weissella oryzae SG25]|uniref:Uncharacterized protein n=1 Tax=Weissella oryzae (strain DSM 25784 / JCM 18191 / LMG 30913 / SG25) TaxID=1329250 RepID=A0A069CU54_WEIOS|nr:hypothetical protein [Weissella oryzae]GAK31295.1 hypothetical protein WOSG25_081280 [Weissella oryzae SG25]